MTHRRQNFTTNGRKCPTAKTKTVLKSVNKMEQLVGMSKSKREKNPNKNHPIARASLAVVLLKVLLWGLRI